MASSSVVSMAAGMQASITQLRTEKDNLEAEAAALKAKTEFTQNESMSFIEKRDSVLAENEDLRKQLVHSHALSGGANKTQLCFLNGLDNDAKEHAPDVKSTTIVSTVASEIFAALAIDDALQEFKERANERAAHLRTSLEAAAQKRAAKNASDEELAATKTAYASSCRLADEKSDALVNIDLKIKALNDKIRTTAASVDKFEEESAKIKDQRSHQEASFVKSRDAKTAEISASKANCVTAEHDLSASQAATVQLLKETEAAKVRNDELSLESESLRNDFVTQNMRDELRKSELLQIHETIRTETAEANKKLETLLVEDEKLNDDIRNGESTLEEVKKELREMEEALSEATAEAENAARKKKKLEDDEVLNCKEIETSLNALKTNGEELARSVQHKITARKNQADEQQRAEQAANAAEASSVEEEKKLAESIKEGLAAAEAHETAKQEIIKAQPTPDELAKAQAELNAEQNLHETLVKERDVALAALRAREVAAAAQLEEQLAQSERESASGGPAMAAKKKALEDLRASLQDDNNAFNAAYTAEKESGKKAIEEKKAELAKQISERTAAKDAADKECKKIEAAAKTLSTKHKQLEKKLAAGKKNLAKSTASATAAKEELAAKKKLLQTVAPKSKLLDNDKENVKNESKSSGRSTSVGSESDSDA